MHLEPWTCWTLLCRTEPGAYFGLTLCQCCPSWSGQPPSLELPLTPQCSGTPWWRLPMQAGYGDSNSLSQKCCWDLLSELCSEFPYPPPEQILCWVSVSSVNLLKKGTESSLVCKYMTACYLFGLLGIFSKWWNKLGIDTVDWGAE